MRVVGWIAIGLLVAAVLVLVGAEWPRLSERVGVGAWARRSRKRRKEKLTAQLFRYSTWHDSKLAAIVFNRNKDFTAVVQKMKDVAVGLPNCVADMPCGVPTGCRHRMRREDDVQKHFVLTWLAFEVPS